MTIPSIPPNVQQARPIIDAILSVIETGRLPGPAAFGTCTILDDGAGITYGIHQATDGGGNLVAIMKVYVNDPTSDPTLARAIAPHIPRIERHETAGLVPGQIWPGWVTFLMLNLQTAGQTDPAMQRAQRTIFERAYWQPAAIVANEVGLVTPLAWLVCYDSTIQSGTVGPGSVGRMRMRFPDPAPANGGDERDWVAAYLWARHMWLCNHHREAVRVSTYRTHALILLAGMGAWDLALPLEVSLPGKVVTVTVKAVGAGRWGVGAAGEIGGSGSGGEEGP